QRVEAEPERSDIDSQMQRLDITPHVTMGSNEVLIGITVTRATDGLLDLVKIMGPFSLKASGDSWRIAEPRQHLAPASWTDQGYPFYSGRGVWRRTFALPGTLEGRRVVLHPDIRDDVLEVVVNGKRAGVRLWAPYDLDITDHVRPGENTLELRVANTLINLLEAVQRPSGLTGAPSVGVYDAFELDLPVAAPAGGEA
ncbi:MAG: hypothetical protein M3173_06305, partial [Chloroflexota bacterium]|nr:hypothetical protein [Chloroflexota bacterium]